MSGGKGEPRFSRGRVALDPGLEGMGDVRAWPSDEVLQARDESVGEALRQCEAVRRGRQLGLLSDPSTDPSSRYGPIEGGTG